MEKQAGRYMKVARKHDRPSLIADLNMSGIWGVERVVSKSPKSLRYFFAQRITYGTAETKKQPEEST